ncbi:MAG TPA: hypothetical protein VGN57_04565 [Pirellulaceae bacterium]|jgi:hypothetical protein|nr:hypothetical protein [Pirellulaceae bacterium]
MIASVPYFLRGFIRSRSPRSLAAVAMAVTCFASSASAQVGDPTLRTDHPQYAGEGAFQTAADCVAFATEGKSSPQDQAIGLYLWLLTHQWHLASPQEPGPRGVADTAAGNDDLIVYDAARSRFSYGYGLCGTVHAWNEVYWRELGMNARRRAFPGHTNSEVLYDGSWHAFDTDMAGLIFRPDGVVAGYDDVIANPSLASAYKPPLPHYPFAWPGDEKVMRAGWQEVAKKKDWDCLYAGGYEAHPGIVNLRPGESFTRFFDPDAFGGPTKRRFWHHQKNGPQRDWTFANNGVPRHEGNESNARGNASYCNGLFEYEPKLSAETLRSPEVDASENVAFDEQSSSLRSADGKPASVTFRHFSPYVICGDPADDANPMTGPATDGLVIAGEVEGEVAIEVSANEGQTWTRLPGSALPLDATELVKGRYVWKVRLSWQGGASVRRLRFETTTQVCQTIYPRLTANGSEVAYRAADRAVVASLPNFSLPESDAKTFETVSRRSANVAYRGRSESSRNAYETTDNKPGTIVFPIEAPADLLEVRAAMRYAVRVPSPENCDYRLEVSTDDGATWSPLAKADVAPDNDFSSGWVYGSADIAEKQAKKALVRATIYAGGHRTGLIDIQLYGIYRTPSAGAVEVEYGWQEGDAKKSEMRSIAAGTDEDRWSVPTGAEVRDDFVRISTANEE